ncbi:MAG TPA: amidase family protein, partial [bacterium]|nr:amidase family protein [bacterium]
MSVHDDLCFLSVSELSQKIRSKKLTSLELTEAYLARIDALAKPLNCFVTVTADVAREDAKRADAETAAGKWRGPLHGIPYGLKDLVDTKGIRTT